MRDELVGEIAVTMPARRNLQLTSRERDKSLMGIVRAWSGRDILRCYKMRREMLVIMMSMNRLRRWE